MLYNIINKLIININKVTSKKKGVSEMEIKELLPEYCYGLLLTTKEVILIKKGEKGYFNTGSLVGVTQEMVDSLNTKLGVTKAQAKAMFVGSMFGWNVPGADPRCYEELKQ